MRTDASSVHLHTARRGLFEAYQRERRTAWVQATGRSMRPVMRDGDWMLVDFGRAPRRLGEIVLFDAGDRLVAHRLVARSKFGQLLTKGDGSAHADRPIAPDQVLGVVRARRRADGGRSRAAGCRGGSAWIIARISLLSTIVAGRMPRLRAFVRFRDALRDR